MTITNLIRRLVVNRPLTAADHDANLDAIEAAVDAKATAANLATVATSGAYGDLTGRPTLGTAATRNVPATGDASATEVVLGADSRLSNNRPPTAHNQAWSTITGTPTTLAGFGITDSLTASVAAATYLTINTAGSTYLTTTTAATTYQPLSANLTALGANGAAFYLSRSNHTGTQVWSTITGTPTTVSGYGITDALSTASLASPGAIGGTTPDAGSFTALSASSALLLPAAAPGTPVAGNLYRVANQLRYRDSAAGEQVVLYGGGNLANLADVATARQNLGLGALAVTSAGGGLSVVSGSLVPIEYIPFRLSNKGETITTGSNAEEKALHRPFTIIGAFFECAPSATGSTSSQVMPYLRPRATGTKASLLTGNATLTSGVSYVDATANLTGTLTGVAGDSIGVDINAVGTGSSGHFLTIVVRYS